MLIAIAVMGLAFAGYKFYSLKHAVKGVVQSTEGNFDEILEERISDIGELATQEYWYKDCKTYKNAKKIKSLKIPFTTSGVIMTIEGTIKAGINFEEVDVTKDDDTKTITITIPKSKILSSELDYDTAKVLDEKESVFNKISTDKNNELLKEIKEKAEKRAIKKGLLENADKNAKIMIEDLVNSFVDDKEYTIKYESK